MCSTDWLPFVLTLLQQPRCGGAHAFLLLDYPGYGDNEGQPCAGLALRSAEAGVCAALEVLGARRCTPEALGFLGHSLGCAAVLQLAAGLSSQRPCWLRGTRLARRIVLSAPFTSIPNMGLALFGGLRGAGAVIATVASTSRHTWDNELSLRSLAKSSEKFGQVPPSVHIVHGTRDEIVPVHMGRALHLLCKELRFGACSFTERPRAGHNDVLDEAFSELARLILAVEDTPNGKL